MKKKSVGTETPNFANKTVNKQKEENQIENTKESLKINIKNDQFKKQNVNSNSNKNEISNSNNDTNLTNIRKGNISDVSQITHKNEKNIIENDPVLNDYLKKTDEITTKNYNTYNINNDTRDKFNYQTYNTKINDYSVENNIHKNNTKYDFKKNENEKYCENSIKIHKREEFIFTNSVDNYRKLINNKEIYQKIKEKNFHEEKTKITNKSNYICFNFFNRIYLSERFKINK